MSFLTLCQLLGGVGIFLYAITLISDSLQRLAGDRLRSIIGMFTSTPVLGVFLGAGVTVLIQSSSATTVMTVSFVEAGLMNLTQAIGVIMGSNIGTTITGQILAFRVKDAAYLFIIIGVLLSFFLSSRKVKPLGTALLGFGLLFVGMQTMEGSMTFLRDRQDIFLTFSQNPFMGLLAGMLLTLLIQSSSATVGLTIALGMQGLLPLEAAIPIVLGDNIGTTITAVLAALSTGRVARQACAAHVLFNVIGVCIFLPLMPAYIGFIQSTSSSVGHQIANAHTLFNVCNTMLFLPFVHPFAALIRRLIPDVPSSEERDTLYLDPLLIERTPVVAVDAVRHECRHLGKVLLEMFDHTEKLFFEDREEEKTAIISLGDKIDRIELAMQQYAGAIMDSRLNSVGYTFLHACMSGAGELERIADKCLRLVDFYEYRKKRGQEFSPEAMSEVQSLFHDARTAVEMALEMCRQKRAPREQLDSLVELARNVRRRENVLRGNHASRVSQGRCSPEAGLVFIDVLGAIEQMAYRAGNLAECMNERRPGKE